MLLKNEHETLMLKLESEHRLAMASLETRLEESVALSRKQSEQLDRLTSTISVEKLVEFFFFFLLRKHFLT